MKKIGLAGGTGPESTLMYYKILNPGNCPVECFDAVEIHIRKLIELALA